MTKMVEIKEMAIVKELAKLQVRLEKADAAFAKKTAIVEKLGCKWTIQEHRDWLDTVPTNEMGYIINNDDVKKNGAWYDWTLAESKVEEIQYSIANAEKRLAKTEVKVAEYHKMLEDMADLKAKEELRIKEFEEEQKEWAKDGIILSERYVGTTPKGNHFSIYGNSGFTTRSWHCFTLYINGNVIFTSGEFWRAYAEIKKR